MMTDERVEAIKKRVDAAPPGPWESPLRDLGRVPSFAAVDFYFDESYEAYPPLGESGPVFVAHSKEVADFLAHAREDVPYLLTALAQAERERVLFCPEGHAVAPESGVHTDDLKCQTCVARAEVERLKGVLEANRLLSVQEVEQRHRADQAEAALARVRGALLKLTRAYEDQCAGGEQCRVHDAARAALEGRDE